MDKKNVIASSLLDNELARAFSELVAERWDNMDLSPFMVYLVDTCSAAALPYLAEQFDIDGLRGFGMATNEEQQRDLIKRSIALHKFIGTPWAIREACRTVGFPVIHLEEGVTYTRKSAYGNAYGKAYNMPTDTFCWACFRVLVEADMARHITAEESRKIRRFVEFYKNVRSHLVEIGFFQTLTDTVFRTDIEGRDTLTLSLLSLNPNPVIISKSGGVQKVAVSAGTVWTIPQSVIGWGDGTGDKVTLSFTGAAGDSEISITSTPNATAKDREITVNITAATGGVIGTLTIRQLARWNAYSRAYSSAYNRITTTPYLRLSTTEVAFLANDPAKKQIDIQSNAEWNVI